MNDALKNTKLFARKKDEHFCLYEYYARANGLQSKSLLILMWIYYNPNGISQNTICKKTYSTKQVVNATIKNFFEKEYIYFEENENDKRYKKVKLTKKGKIFASKILDDLEEAESDAMNELTLKQQEILIECFTILNNRFKENIEKKIFNDKSEEN